MSRPWSYSRLSCYETCPQQFKYRYVEGLKSSRPPSPAAERGTAIHLKAEHYLLGQIPMYPPELQKVAGHAMQLKQKGATSERKLAVTIEWKPTEWGASDAYYRAILDISYREDDKKRVCVEDWKTGKVYDSHKEQMSAYIAVIAAHEEADEYLSRLVYIDQGMVTPPRVIPAERVKPIRLMIDGRIKSAESDTIFPPERGAIAGGVTTAECIMVDPAEKAEGGELPLEKEVERKVSRFAQAKGVLVLKLNVVGRVGWPDRLYIYAGRLLFIEFKRPGEKLRKVQDHVAKIIRHHGFPVVACDNYLQGTALLRTHLHLD